MLLAMGPCYWLWVDPEAAWRACCRVACQALHCIPSLSSIRLSLRSVQESLQVMQSCWCHIMAREQLRTLLTETLSHHVLCEVV
jgi:hypothetical protein